MRFDVYGRYQLLVERSGESWLVLQPGADGKRRLRDDLQLPPHLSEGELRDYLDTLLHEHALPGTSIQTMED